jgi:hypothetical protein
LGYLIPVVLVSVACAVLAIGSSAAATSVAPPKQCSDGIDNDGDGLIDYPQDSGCDSVKDNDESDPPPPPAAQCADGTDNDGDGKIDLADPGCVNASDNDETDPPPPPAAQCADGTDNDGDGKIDLADPGCVNASDNDETDPPPARFVLVPPSAAATPSGPQFLSPFPIVRVRGRLTRQGVAIDLLRVRAPHGSRIEVRCRGRGCPGRRQVRYARRNTTRLRAFERTLSAGVVLEVFVTRSGRIGKYASFKILAGRPPLRRDRCVMPGKRVPSACPAS